MMHPPNSLSKHIPNFQNLKLLTPRKMLLLRHTVRHNHLVQTTGINAVNRVAREDSVRYEGVDARSAGLFHELGGAGDGVAGVG